MQKFNHFALESLLATGGNEMSPNFSPMNRSLMLSMMGLVLLGMVILLWNLTLAGTLSWDTLGQNFRDLNNLYIKNPVSFVLLFFIFYVLVNMFSIPIATILAVLAGSLFGSFWGTLLLTIASNIGGCGTFLMSRYLFRQPLERRFSHRLGVLQKLWEGDGSWQLVSLRLQPVFPYVLVNVLFGLTSMSLLRFMALSFFALMPNIFIVVQAGRQISRIHQWGDIYRWEVILSLIMLAIFPLLMKMMVKRKNKK